MQAVATLVGRVFLSMIFIISGISKIGAYSSTVGYMQSRGMPAAPFFLYAAVLLELGGGICLLTGFRARIAAVVLILFLIPTTYIFHFKPAFDLAMNVTDRTQLIAVLKNLAIMGGLLMIYGNGAGKLTIGKDS